mgnify:CR=1 FL=1
MENSKPERLMPERLNFGRHFHSTMGFPLKRYRDWKAGNPESKNLFDYRVVMGFFLPPWQREAVWTERQKIAFIESSWLGVNLGTFSYNFGGIGSPFDNLLIDGQQRMSAIQDYIEDRFPVFGYRYSEVTEIDRRFWEMGCIFGHFQTDSEDEAYLRQYYNMLNFGGTPHKESERA